MRAAEMQVDKEEWAELREEILAALDSHSQANRRLSSLWQTGTSRVYEASIRRMLSLHEDYRANVVRLTGRQIDKA